MDFDTLYSLGIPLLALLLALGAMALDEGSPLRPLPLRRDRQKDSH